MIANGKYTQGMAHPEIIEERGKKYGDYKINHDAIGLMYTGILEQHYQIKLPHPIPGHVVGLMTAAIKINRAAAPFEYEPDNYVDGHNYLDIAKKCDERNPENK